MKTYDEFVQEWNTRQVTKFGGECVALIAEYEAENNKPIVWGDAHQWINNPTMLQAYDWVQNNPADANQLPSRGDIIVWPLPNEHIAFFDHNVDNHQFVSFGQNSGGHEAHFQANSWLHVAGWYTAKTSITPAPPAPVYVPPAAPIPVPTNTTPYAVVVDVPGYSTSNAAVNHLTAQQITTVTAAEDYMVFNRRNDADGKLIAINVTKLQGVAGAWINPDDNVVPPPPAPEPPKPSGWVDPRGAEPVPVTVTPPTPPVNTNDWRLTFKRERLEGKPNWYRFNTDIVVYDLDRKRPKKQLYADERVDIWGWFEKDGKTYARPWTGDNLYWYGIPETLTGGLRVIIPEQEFLDLWNIENKQGLSLQYQIDQAIAKAKQKFPKFFDIIKLK